MKRFWKWKDRRIRNAGTGQTDPERILFLNGTIAEESWFDDDVTPALFKEELMEGNGRVTVWINSPGGDCIAAAQIYNMLKEYPFDVTVKVDGIAASAASVIAMAGDEVLISPVGMLMIHNPSTMAFGDTAEMKKAVAMLGEVKESIINAYEIKTGLPREKLSRLMDAETWMDANKALELGFADGILNLRDEDSDEEDEDALQMRASAMLFSRQAVTNTLLNKMAAGDGFGDASADDAEEAAEEGGRSVDALQERLELLRYHI